MCLLINRSVLMFFLSAYLIGCGQIGPLYMPGNEPATAPPAPEQPAPEPIAVEPATEPATGNGVN